MVQDNIIKTRAINLLTPYRFDIMAKYLYAYFSVNKIKSSWAEALYKEHLRVFNNFFEANPHKSGFHSFKAAFDQLLLEMSLHGFDGDKGLIPIASNGSPLNGAHRMAASMVNDLEVDCYVSDDPRVGQLDCSFYYLASKRDVVETGLTQCWTDPMALQYARLKPSCFILCLFSHTMNKMPQIDKIIGDYGLPVYEKYLDLNENARFNLMKKLYSGETWLGDRHNNYYGAQVKTNLCFPDTGKMRVILFDPHANADMVEMKAEVRSLFDVGKNSIHINDTAVETVAFSELFFSNNSLQVNSCGVISEPEKLWRSVRKLKRQLRRQKIDPHSVCVSGPGVLAAHGVNDSAELHVMGHGSCPEGFPNLNEKLSDAGLNADEFIYNPENYFYYEGIKFLTLDQFENVNKKLIHSETQALLASGVHDDRSATAFCESNEDCGVLVFWPTSTNCDQQKMVLEGLSEYGDVIYQRGLEISQRAGQNLLQETDSRSGSKKDLQKLSEIEARLRWQGGDLENPIVKIIVFQYNDLIGLQDWHSTLCKEGQIDSSTVFFPGLALRGSDAVKKEYFFLENIKHIHLLLNENSRDFLEYRRQADFEHFECYLERFQKWVLSAGVEIRDFCIDGSAVLSAYGLRECKDLDFLYGGLFIQTGIEALDCHNFHHQKVREQMDLAYAKDDIVYDARNYFYYKGLKFCSLDILEMIKKERLEGGLRQEKDDIDCGLIEELRQVGEK